MKTPDPVQVCPHCDDAPCKCPDFDEGNNWYWGVVVTETGVLRVGSLNKRKWIAERFGDNMSPIVKWHIAKVECSEQGSGDRGAAPPTPSDTALIAALKAFAQQHEKDGAWFYSRPLAVEAAVRAAYAIDFPGSTPLPPTPNRR